MRLSTRAGLSRLGERCVMVSGIGIGFILMFLFLLISLLATSTFIMIKVSYEKLDEYGIDQKLSFLQEDVAVYLSQQRIISSLQQNLNGKISELRYKLSKTESVFTALPHNCGSCPSPDPARETVDSKFAPLLSVHVSEETISLKTLHGIRKLESEINELQRFFDTTKMNLKILQESVSSYMSKFDEIVTDNSRKDMISKVVIEDMVRNSMERFLKLELEKRCSRSLNTPFDSCPHVTREQLLALLVVVMKSISSNQTKIDSVRHSFTPFDHNVIDAIVISNLTSPTFVPPLLSTVGVKVLSIVGLMPSVGEPEEVLSLDNTLGHCWAMEGTHGYITLKLHQPVYLVGFSVDHVANPLDASSAPAHIEVYSSLQQNGLYERIAILNYKIDTIDTLRYFPLPNATSKTFQYVTFKILNNHGNPQYTCIYHLKVHGFP